MSSQIFKSSLPGREEVELTLPEEGAKDLKAARLRAVGSLSFLKKIEEWRGRLSGPLSSLELPEGEDPGDLLLKEVLLKAKGEWAYPYGEDQICHCRAVPTSTVDTAIVCGAHTPQDVSQQTSASTACGTCRPDVEAIIKYRLGK